MASMMLNSPAPALKEAGLDCARKAMKLLAEDAPTAEKLPTHKLLAIALTACGKTEEARKIAAGIAGMEDELDKEYRKDAVPFKPEKFAGRKSKSDRAVLVEVFSCVHPRTCLASTPAFEALAGTYSPREVVFLQYHMHLETQPGSPPIPDPLVNLDAEARMKFYGGEDMGRQVRSSTARRRRRWAGPGCTPKPATTACAS